MSNSRIFPSIAQPVVKGRNGYFTQVYGKETIRNSILNILMTRLGERVHLPEFGSRLHELLFQPLDQVFAALARQYVYEALRLWEPRIELLDMAVTFSGNQAQLTIRYRIRQSAEDATTVLRLDRDQISIGAAN